MHNDFQIWYTASILHKLHEIYITPKYTYKSGKNYLSKKINLYRCRLIIDSENIIVAKIKYYEYYLILSVERKSSS